jgi:hypothetical protein
VASIAYLAVVMSSLISSGVGSGMFDESKRIQAVPVVVRSEGQAD